MNELDAKLQRLREKLDLDGTDAGPLLVVYPPEAELDFSAGYSEVIEEKRAAGRPILELDLRPFLFETLDSRDLLEQTFLLDSQASRDLHRMLASMVNKELVARIKELGMASSDSIIFLRNTGAVFPWVSYSSIIEEVEAVIKNTLVIPFPGTEQGPELHFMGAKDGYNYRATRI